MSTNNLSESPISTRSARKRRSETRGIPQPPETFSTTTSREPEVVESSDSRSRLIHETYEAADFKRSWGNNVPFQVARNVLSLRKYRGWSQDKVAGLMGTSQPAVARIENEDGNITLDTLQRMIGALRGRLYISIEPEEAQLPHMPAWWEVVDCGIAADTPWTVFNRFVRGNADNFQAVIVGWTTPASQALPKSPKDLIEEAGVS